MKAYDLVGERFGRLQVISKVEKGNGRSNWLYQCDCGNQKIIDGYSLKSGRSTSCGCYKKEINEKRHIEALVRHCINFKKQYAFADCKDKYVLRFDFAILNAESQVIALIEVDGEQHYRAINFFGGEENLEYNQLHDKIKSDYCKENNLPLIRISYIDLRNGQYEQILNENIVVLGSQQSHSQE